jgi:CheY-like chemotaxis protein
MEAATVNILLVDDDEVDVQSVKRAFRKAKIENPVTIAHNGLDALAILRGENGQPPLPHPHVILLDLNMPRMNGLEFLEELRKDPMLRNRVVFVLTTSADERDKAGAYDKQVAGYIVKGKAGDGFTSLTAMLEHYWRVVEFPPFEANGAC